MASILKSTRLGLQRCLERCVSEGSSYNQRAKDRKHILINHSVQKYIYVFKYI